MDAVGGATGSEVAAVLAPGGRMVVYGTLSGEPLRIDPRTLMVGQKRVEGFWMSEWVRLQSRVTMLFLFRKLGKLIQAGVLATEVGATFPLNDVRAAVRQAAEPGRQGKVLLRIGSR
jgi:NADPH2:quinone reductase